MKIDAGKLGLATAIIFALIWVICSVLVVSIPGAMMQVSGHMLHADLSGLGWSMHWGGFFFGLVLWSALAGLIVWAVAGLYNRLTGTT
ncbi:MAG: DUF5676 family membrane protein [Proteobacteria bacterium]|nr:DUF5676 family membrane protein [Pseudomonadota bacterium]